MFVDIRDEVLRKGVETSSTEQLESTRGGKGETTKTAIQD
jgi:hypothetical protein